jgi:hypothetical protein
MNFSLIDTICIMAAVKIDGSCRSLGTGFFISFENKKYVTTTGHIVRAVLPDERLISLPFPVAHKDNVKYLRVENTNVKNDFDVAILEIMTPGIDMWPTIGTTINEYREPSIGDTTELLGYPVDYLNAVFANPSNERIPVAGIKATVDSLTLPENLNFLKFNGNQITEGVVITPHVDMGLSGNSGALVICNGLIAGVLIGTMENSDNALKQAVFTRWSRVCEEFEKINEYARIGN